MIHESPVSEKKIYDPLAPPEKKAYDGGKIYAVVMTALSLVLLIICVSLFFSQKKLQEEYDTAVERHQTIVERKNTEIADLKKQLSEYDGMEAVEPDFYEFLLERSYYLTQVGYIVEGSSYYHTPYCPVFTEASTYWAHNIEYCEYLGYAACPDCME